MRLSEAIRLGSTLREQEFETYAGNGGTCAIGAACEAIKIDPYGPIELDAELEFHFPVIKEGGLMPCPMSDCDNENYLLGLIIHLNDNHRWTRERIADFVELHEPLPEPTEVVTDEAVVEREAKGKGF